MGLYMMKVPEGVTANPNNPTVEQQALAPYHKSSHVLSGQFISQPTWSPDGKQFAYVAYNNNEFDLWLANINYNAKTGVGRMRGTPVTLTPGGVDEDPRPYCAH